jgi:hypothetical protein
MYVKHGRGPGRQRMGRLMINVRNTIGKDPIFHIIALRESILLPKDVEGESVARRF